MYMRDHPCLCNACVRAHSDECTQKHTVGTWKPIKITRKINQKVFDCVPESLFQVTKFFDGLITQNMTTILVGINMVEKVTKIKQIKLAILAVPPRINVKEMLSFEHHIEKSAYDVCVPKGTAVVRVKMMLKHPNSTNKFFLPTNSKTVSISITDLVFPEAILTANTQLDRLSYIKFELSEATHTNYQMKLSTQITYTIDDASMQWLTSPIQDLAPEINNN